MNAAKQSIEQAILEALATRSELTMVEIAAATGRGRSTVGKYLSKLEEAGKVGRTTGEPDNSRRAPDLWRATATRRTSRKGASTEQRLRPGQLDVLVLEYLNRHADDGPLGPAAVAKGLSRSSGAIGNCLARLAETGKIRRTGDAPRRYAPVLKRDAR